MKTRSFSTKPLTIEIHGTGTHNRGAELMAIAIAERLRERFSEVRLVVPPSANFGPYEARSRYGFLTTWPVGGVRTRLIGMIAPPWINSLGGLIKEDEVDVVLDASGFAFTDQWGPGQAERLLRKMSEPRRAKQRLILMPQALGPFENPDVARVVRQLFSRASLVFARDAVSHEAAKALCAPTTLRRSPDFTVGVRALFPSDLALPSQFTAIVPNLRMLDKTGAADAYLAFLCEAIRGLRRRNLNPLFLLHDAEGDRRVVTAIKERGEDIPVLEHPDPRVLKGMLGRATFVIGSRFHALVSTLSQGVPCIGAGWSHKYPELFRDFDSPDLLLSNLEDHATLGRLLDLLADPVIRQERCGRIVAAAQAIKAQTISMWEEVEDIITSRKAFPVQFSGKTI